MPKRRGRNTGSIQPHGKGYRAYYCKTVPGQAKPLRGSKKFPTKAEAEAWLRKQTESPTAAGTFGDWLTDWLAMYERDVSAVTFDRDRRSVESHVRPLTGGVRFRDLTPGRCRQFLADLAARGVSDSERNRVGGVLKRALSAAVGMDKIPQNPMTVDGKRVKLPKYDRREWKAFAPAQLAAWVAAADGRGFGAEARLWADAGCRLGELLGLQWQDWNPDTRELTIRRAVCAKTGAIKPTKTGRVRRVVLRADTAAELAALKGRAKLLDGDASPVVLAGGRTRPARLHQRTGNFTNRTWLPLLEAAGLEGRGFAPRSVRHTMASLALQAGGSLRAVAERLGHRDPSLTLRIYAHVMPGDQGRIADIMGELLRPARIRTMVPGREPAAL